MKSEQYLAEEVTIKKGVDILVRKLGPVEAMRFIKIEMSPSLLSHIREMQHDCR